MGNIVWVASYPKSGNTWVRAFLFHLINSDVTQGTINKFSEVCDNESNRKFYLPFVNAEDTQTASYFASLRRSVQQDIARKNSSSVFLKTHNFMGSYDGYALQDSNIASAVIYIVRNPLDVAFSISHHYQMTIHEAISFISNEDTFIEMSDSNVGSFISSWSTHVQSWTNGMDKHPRYCIMRYEDMLINPVKSFKKIARLIGVTDMKRIKSAVAKSQFSQLKQQESKFGFVENPYQSNRFFRLGLANQWRELLLKEDIQRVVDAHPKQMQKFGYVPKGYAPSEPQFG